MAHELESANQLILTEQDVLDSWNSDFYTPKGFLRAVLRLQNEDGSSYIHPSELKDYCLKHGMDRNTYYRAAKVVGSWNGTPLTKHVEGVEKPVRDRLHKELGGLIEVLTPAGRIDILTATEVIEVKHADEWKSALGQVIVYGVFYPEHRKRIYLFSKSFNRPEALKVIEQACANLNVAVTFEEVQ